MPNRNIIVIGGSAGSSSVLKKIMAGLPTDLPASVLVATHIPARSDGYLASMLDSAGPLPVADAIDGQSVEPGRVYVAAPDRHMLLIDGVLRLGAGPRENMVRPAIDPLFRSAALSAGPRVIGVILTGMLNDGASGLVAVKQGGGVAVVQHPLSAQEPSMPVAALEAVDADYVCAADDLARTITELASSEAGPALHIPANIELEVEIAAGARLGTKKLTMIAQPTAITCPECQGVLSEVIGERPLRYRCQIGHAETAEIVADHDAGVGEAIRVAMRVMEERVELVSRMARDAHETGRAAVAELYEARAVEYRSYAETLRRAAIQSMNLSRAAQGPAA